jgi:hypothetical protein
MTCFGKYILLEYCINIITASVATIAKLILVPVRKNLKPLLISAIVLDGCISQAQGYRLEIFVEHGDTVNANVPIWSGRAAGGRRSASEPAASLPDRVAEPWPVVRLNARPSLAWQYCRALRTGFIMPLWPDQTKRA